MSPGTGDRAAPEHLVVGHISKAHGTKGELFVFPLTDRRDDVFVPGHELLLGDEDGLLSDDARIVRIEAARPFKRGVLVRFDGVATRADADTCARRYLLAPTAALPPLEEGEVFYHELLGMSVNTIDGTHVGRVREVYETVPNHLLEVLSDGGKLHLIPFAAHIIRNVDRDGARITIDPPAGLLEL
ncbi:MAG TPA: ribosome maturation factor RimM [Longimicrobiales bacterium]|nr:ribosome maturation factor RimM [Longimicrobiales bacterium]